MEMTDPLPQRFRHRPSKARRWYYGCCYYAATWEQWIITGWMVGGEIGIIHFDNDPWEVMGQVVGGEDGAMLEWIDRDMGWRDSDDERDRAMWKLSERIRAAVDDYGPRFEDWDDLTKDIYHYVKSVCGGPEWDCCERLGWDKLAMWCEAMGR